MSYRFMAQYQPEFDVVVMCAAFGVSRSGYYAWQERGQTTQHEQADEALMAPIRQIFEDSHATYGSPRIYAELKAQGYVCSRHRVARLMRQAGIGVAIPRRRVQTTQSDGQHHSTPNLLARDFKADAPNRKWLVDITAVSTDESCPGWRAGFILASLGGLGHGRAYA